jgi:hypothetical protein
MKVYQKVHLPEPAFLHGSQINPKNHVQETALPP